ncbi:MAG: DUF6507 family protein [Propionibacteriales bacterium]|nr:DUF6507 family protein [Propionibacteriales bacterium]
MTRYRIAPTTVAGVLRNTATEASQLDGDIKPLGDHFTEAATGCGKTGPIVEALSGLVPHEQKAIQGIGQHINACLTGAASATGHFLNGDQDMVQNSQRNAAKGVASTIPRAH